MMLPGQFETMFSSEMWQLLLHVGVWTLFVAIAGLAILRLLKNLPAAARVLVSRTTFVVLMTAPITSVLFPSIGTSFGDTSSGSAVGSLDIVEQRRSSAAYSTGSEIEHWNPLMPTGSSFASESGMKAKGETSTLQQISQHLSVDFRQWLLLSWFVVAVFSFVRLIGALLQVRGLWQRSSEQLPQHLAEFVRKHTCVSGMSKAKVRISDEIEVPVSVGVLSQQAILPLEATQWGEERVHLALLHELGHGETRDVLWSIAAAACNCIYWVNPLVFLLRRRLGRDVEIACDDRVLASGVDHRDYAKLLVDFAHAVAFPSSTGAVAMADRQNLKGRVAAILDDTRDRSGLRRPVAVGLTVLVVFISIAVMSLLPLRIDEETIPLENAESVGTDRSKPLAADEEVRTIRDAILARTQVFDNVHIAMVDRGDFVGLAENETIHPVVMFRELWINGETAQWRVISGGERPGDEWWQGFEPLRRPLNASDLSTSAGWTTCFDSKHTPKVAQSTSTKGELFYFTGQPKQPYSTDMFIPHVEVGRPWVPQNRGGSGLMTYRIVDAPIERWHILGAAEIDGEDALKVEIEQQAPFDAGTDGRLNVAQVWVAWFLPEKDYAVRRIESQLRYRINGKTYRTNPRGMLYEAGEFREYNGTWYPYTGSQTLLKPAPAETEAGLNWDVILDEIIATDGKNLADSFSTGVSAFREWQVISIAKNESNASLWFDAPPGAVVVDNVTGSRQIADGPMLQTPMIGEKAPEWQIAGWTDGEQHQLSDYKGKVVVLDFWGTWCAPCIQAIPAMRQLQKKFEDRNVVFVSIHTAGATVDDVTAFTRSNDWTGLAAIDAGAGTNTGKTGLGYGVSGFPTIVMLDTQGRFAYHSDIEPQDLEQHSAYLGRLAKTADIPWPIDTNASTNPKASEQLTKFQVAWLSNEIETILQSGEQ